MKWAALIPARRGSKGIANKNRSVVGGKELIRYTFDAAVASKRLEKVYLSTDDPEIIEIAKRDYPSISAPFIRPAELSTDSTQTIDVALHLLDSLVECPQFLVLLQPTAPLRSAVDIDNAIQKLESSYPAYDSLVSLCEVDEPHPYKMKVIENGVVEPLIKGSSSEIPRQELPKVYRLNGAIYITESSILRSNHSFFGKTLPMIMERERSLNIDAPIDLKVMEHHLEKGPR